VKRHAITITAAVLGAIWLAAIAVQLCFIAGIAGIPWLIGSIVAQAAILLVSGAVILVTNTRRPYGIDPNAPARQADPFGQTTDELRDAIYLPDRRPYGRRTEDDMQVVKRLIGKLEENDTQRPPPAATPQWAIDLQTEHDDTDVPFMTTPKEEL
jgi:hypothetical protein